MGYRVTPRSREEIHKIAYEWKKRLGLENMIYLPVVQIFEILPELYPGLDTEIVDDSELPPNKYAVTEIGPDVIKIKQSVYDKACEGGGFERMTIMHEIGHYELIANQPVKLYRECDGPVRAFEDPEWQAKCFAGEVMVDRDLVAGMMPGMIALKCGVSLDAAEYQWRMYNKKR